MRQVVKEHSVVNKRSSKALNRVLTQSEKRDEDNRSLNQSMLDEMKHAREQQAKKDDALLAMLRQKVCNVLSPPKSPKPELIETVDMELVVIPPPPPICVTPP